MKRIRGGLKSGNFVNTQEGEQGFWPSYTDMMSSVALILFFLMLIAYLQNMITGNRLINTQELLEETKINLADTLGQVRDAENQLALINIELENAKSAMQSQQQQIDASAALIATQEEKINSQNNYIALTNEELIRLRQQMTTIAYMRLSVLEQIKKSISETLGDTSKVSISDNGNIVLDEGLLFDYNSATVKPESYSLLNRISSAFATFLANDENSRYVDSIMITGHTDNTGKADYNRELSNNRANAVLNYLYSANNGRLENYASYFCAAGYGATRPVASNDTEEGRSANRRIEISIILKDESVLEIVDSYLAQEMPNLTESDLAVSVDTGKQ